MHPYTPLPRLDPQAPDEPLLIYGSRVLRFVLETQTTATLSDIDLELADHVYPLAVSNPDLTDATRHRLTATRHQLLATIKARRTIAQLETDAAPVPHQDIPGGHAVHLQPPPVPHPPPTHYAPISMDF